jgi:hypothetical protein
VHPVLDFEWYAANVLKIQTKTSGVLPFSLLKYQRDFVRDIAQKEKAGQPLRYIVLKARQCGFSTLAAGLFTHRMQTRPNFKTIVLADKAARTDEIFSIYSRFTNLTPQIIRPMIAAHNNREILFDNPDQEARAINPGLGSGVKAETAQDPYAGRSGTRSAAHMSECAFYPYAQEVNEGIGNSIPLAPGTFVIKESTANGLGERGEPFFLEWEAAMRGDTIYSPFFVAWFSVDDYWIKPTPNFEMSPQEKELMRQCPGMTEGNIMWRRLKIMQYESGKSTIFTPEERFKEDFPSYPEEAFLNSGRPVFDQDKLKRHLFELRKKPHPRIEFRLGAKPHRPVLAMFQKELVVWEAPKEGETYTVGADVAEGLEEGDASSACVLSKDRRQVARWHGKIDPDMFGKLLVELAITYNNAVIVPEINSIGTATLSAIKLAGYRRIYQRTVKDEQIDDEREKLGWRTTSSNKLPLLSLLVSSYRDDEILIRDEELLSEMQKLTREPDGDVVLNSKDRVVACCLALEGLAKVYLPAKVINPNAKKKDPHGERHDYFRTGRTK